MTALENIVVPRRSSLAVALAVIALGALVWPGAATAQSQQPAEQMFELRIEHGGLAGQVGVVRVTQGDSVRLRFTADAPTILHLHGYDIEQEVAPGEVAGMRFEAYAAGRFPLEVHGDSAHHDAPLLVVEVYPR